MIIRILLTLAAVLTATLAACAPQEPVRPPDIIVVVLDTARRDHFSLYGYDRATTPAFDGLAAECVRFDRAYSTSCWTVPSHASLFTGLYPVAHGANQRTQYLDDSAETLAERLSAAGYQTASFSSNPWISDKANLVQGFEHAEVVPTGRTRPQGTGFPHLLNEKALAWLDGRDPKRPGFLFLNYIEPHWKYQAPVEFQRKFLGDAAPVRQSDPAMFGPPRWYLRRDEITDANLRVRTAMYDADLAYTDAILAELVAGLRERGALDHTLLVVTADHGENHGDHGHVSHIFALNEATIRVPLLIRPPAGAGGQGGAGDGGRAGTVRSDPVQLVDVFATTLAAAGIPAPEFAGLAPRDLLAGTVPADRPMIAEYAYPDQVLGFFPEDAPTDPGVAPYLRDLRTVLVGNDKFVWGSDGRDELYDLAADPGERDNLIDRHPERAAELRATLADLLDPWGGNVPTPAAPPRATDDSQLEALRSLGYVK